MKNDHKKNIYLEGIKVSTTFSGIKKTPHNEDDVLLVQFDKPCSIAGIFTKSLTSSASVNPVSYTHLTLPTRLSV